MDFTVSLYKILSDYVDQQMPEIGIDSNIILATYVTIVFNKLCNSKEE